MNLGRIFANAIARRVAYVVVAGVLAAVGLGQARAVDHVTSMEAAADCESLIPQVQTGQTDPLNGYVDNPRCEHSTGPYGWPWIGAFVLTCTEYNYDGSPRNEYGACAPNNVLHRVHRYQQTNCASATPLSGVTSAPGHYFLCQYGCRFECDGLSLDLTVDGVTRSYCGDTWSPTGAICSSAETPPALPAQPDADGDGTSDDNDLSPNNPGEGDGSGQDESRACGGEGQPACEEDGSNAGSGNGNTSGGGGNCQTPPRSSGDAILAQIAFQTWATRCALEGNANQGGGTGAGGPGNGGEQGQPDWTKGDAPPVPTDDTDYPAEQTRFGLGVSPDLLDEENIFGNASCPNFSITIWSQTVSTADFDGWCNLVVILRGLILIFGAFSALQILMGRGLV